MICPGCGAENRAGRKFCSQCGEAFDLVCPRCGVANEPGARFCGECGAQLQDQRAAGGALPSSARHAADPDAAVSTAERRMVSVLFADLVGFTTLAEDRDPETVRELLSRYFDAARVTIERHGGVVEKFIGDAVMAVWGTPTAHEDDAERAVRAGLEFVDAVSALGSGLSARAGVLTGEEALSGFSSEPAFIWKVGKPPTETARSSDHLTSLAVTGVPSWKVAFFFSLKVADMSPMFMSSASSGSNLSRS